MESVAVAEGGFSAEVFSGEAATGAGALVARRGTSFLKLVASFEKRDSCSIV